MDPELFNYEAAKYVRDIERECGRDLASALDLAGEDGLGTRLDECSDACSFRPSAARKCIRRLEKIAGDCQQHLVAPCRRVYVDCDLEFEESRCALRNCSVAPGSGAGGAFWLGMLALLGLGRRRRRS